MATSSGLYQFSPSAGEVITQAFALIGVPRTSIDADHIFNARMQLNAMQASWANTGPNLWSVDQQSQVLTAGTASYTVDPATIMILDAWVSYGTPSQDRILTPVSRSEYASYPNKAQAGRPTVFWYDRLIAQTVTLWPVPDAATTYTLNFYRFRQIQDAVVSGGIAPEVPYRWIDAMIWGLAERLSFIYAPDKIPTVGTKAAQAYSMAAEQDTENAPMSISFDFSGYLR